MGYSDLGCYGSEVLTPNLDKLAFNGIRFSQFYNNARCCPSRAALLTGRYPHQVGIGGMTDTKIPIPEYQGFFPKNTPTIATNLKKLGYATFMSGKWHLGQERGQWPLDHGFDSCFAFINGASSYFDFKPYRGDNWPPGNELTVVRNNSPIKEVEGPFYATDLYTDHAIRFVESHSGPQPFFLYLAYTAPHWPLHALPEDIEKYKGVYEAGWNSIRKNRLRKLKKFGLIDEKTTFTDEMEVQRAWDSLSQETRKKEADLMAVYAAMIDRMDKNIGRLISQLKSMHELDNTLIMFLSDNGGARTGNMAGSTYKYGNPRFDRNSAPGTPQSFTGYGERWANVSNTPFREFKSKTYEGGIATPFIAYYPKKIRPGSIDHSTTHIVDVLPTLLEFARKDGVDYSRRPYSEPWEGLSLLPILEGKDSLGPRALFFEHMGNCGLIEGKWKIVKSINKDWELYNIQKDRTESENLAAVEADKMQRMIVKYEAWAKENRVLPPKEVIEASPYKF